MQPQAMNRNPLSPVPTNGNPMIGSPMNGGPMGGAPMNGAASPYYSQPAPNANNDPTQPLPTPAGSTYGIPSIPAANTQTVIRYQSPDQPRSGFLSGFGRKQRPSPTSGGYRANSGHAISNAPIANASSQRSMIGSNHATTSNNERPLFATDSGHAIGGGSSLSPYGSYSATNNSVPSNSTPPASDYRNQESAGLPTSGGSPFASSRSGHALGHTVSPYASTRSSMMPNNVPPVAGNGMGNQSLATRFASNVTPPPVNWQPAPYAPAQTEWQPQAMAQTVAPQQPLVQQMQPQQQTTAPTEETITPVQHLEPMPADNYGNTMSYPVQQPAYPQSNYAPACGCQNGSCSSGGWDSRVDGGFCCDGDVSLNGPHVVKIPLRFAPGESPHIDEQDIILYNGDIVYIESRGQEVFYTGGLLGGGQYPLPDYDITVLDALSIAQSQGQGGGSGRSVGGVSALNGDVTVSASTVIVLRTLADGSRVPIEVDLKRVKQDMTSRENILVQPGDHLILQYSKCEAVFAFLERHLLEGALFGVAAAQLTTGQ